MGQLGRSIIGFPFALTCDVQMPHAQDGFCRKARAWLCSPSLQAVVAFEDGSRNAILHHTTFSARAAMVQAPNGSSRDCINLVVRDPATGSDAFKVAVRNRPSGRVTAGIATSYRTCIYFSPSDLVNQPN